MAAKKRPAVPDWENLRFFLESRRAGSLTEAARRLGVDHTTVSRRLAALEESLGVRLFDRSPRGYEPTRAAEQLLPLAESVEERVLAIERSADVGGEHIGPVRLATTHLLATEFVVPALPALRERYPGIVLDVSAENRGTNLARREADLALRLGRPRENGLVARKLADLAHAFYARRDGRTVSELDVARDAFVGYDDSLAHLPHERWLARELPDRRVVFRANSLMCLQAAARAGVGVALMPCFVGDLDPTLVRLRSDLAPAPREMWLVVHGELRRSARIRAVIDFLAERAEAMKVSFAGQGPLPAAPASSPPSR